MKYYVVADPHGFYTELVNALSEQGFFEDDTPHKLIVCGDLFDRGKEAKEMQNFILNLIEKKQVILIKGNHESLFEKFLSGIFRYAKEGFEKTSYFLNGTVDTCLQLTDTTLEIAEKFADSFAINLMHTPFYKKIMLEMVDYFETEHYIFVHGWIPCFVNKDENFEKYIYNKNWRIASEEEWEKARWHNGMIAHSNGVIEPNKTIICGHKPCSYGHYTFENTGSLYGEDANFLPYKAKGIIALDACTAISGRVNCIVIED